MSVFTDPLQDRLWTFFEKDMFYNPEEQVEHTEHFPVDSGVELYVETGDITKYPHTDSDTETTLHQLNFKLYFYSDPRTDDEQRLLKDSTEKWESFVSDFKEFIQNRFGEINTKSSLPNFRYRGEWKRGHCFEAYFDIPEQNIPPKNAVDVSYKITITNEFTRRIPSEIAENGEEAILEYLIEEWWNTQNKKEKAQSLGLTNQLYVSDSDTSLRTSLEENIELTD